MNALKAISSILLAMLVLFSSMGFYVDHMVCDLSGEHKLAINTSIDSCSDSCDRSEEDALSRSCCDYESNYFQEDLPANPTENTKKQQFSSFKYIPLAEVFKTTKCAAKCYPIQLENPGVLTSVERHILLQTFLI